MFRPQKLLDAHDCHVKFQVKTFEKFEISTGNM